MLNLAARGANKKNGTDIGLTRDQEIPHILAMCPDMLVSQLLSCYHQNYQE